LKGFAYRLLAELLPLLVIFKAVGNFVITRAFGIAGMRVDNFK